jgi:hypothetical protein
MRRKLLTLAVVYLVTAIATRAVEASGSDRLSCGCEPGCWCKRPGVSLFRWVTPKGMHHMVSSDDKAKAES